MTRILVAPDGSANEGQVLAAACKLAERSDAVLWLFHAVSLPVPLPPRALAVAPEEVAGMLADEARAHLESLARALPEKLRPHVEVDVGVPWRAVCDAAQRIDADLVVVGSHGYGGIDRLIGTTAAKIVNHLHCSVLVARAPHV